MRNRCLAGLVGFLSLWVAVQAAPLPVAAKPEEVGLSSERLKRIHDTMQAHIDAHDFSGAVTLVMRKGKLAHFEAHGLADVDAKKPMAKDALFRVWSMSKPVTGVAILMLMEEGKVRLTDPVSRFIPEFKGLKVGSAGDAAKREITIQDLLTHVSGLGSGPVGNGAMKQVSGSTRPGKTLAEYIPMWGKTSLEFEPGSKYAYSALAAFDTLGRVVEVVSGQSFDRFLRERLFDPLGMKEVWFEPPSEPIAARIPRTYHRVDGVIRQTEAIDKLYYPTYFSGGGGLKATTEEYAKFGAMLASGGQWNGKRLLSPKTVELMASVFVPDSMPGRAPGRGFGLSVQVVNDPVAASQRVSAGSFGWDGAYGTHFWVDPKEKIVGLMMIQTDNPNRQADRDFENAVMQAVVD
ncbi:MAG: serine hydrolase domain-containing protein [Bryobacteraceae bacterium]|nr:serine hydrolase domain-containing protein [Bryobacteraceae bacterium]